LRAYSGQAPPETTGIDLFSEVSLRSSLSGITTALYRPIQTTSTLNSKRIRALNQPIRLQNGD